MFLNIINNMSKLIPRCFLLKVDGHIELCTNLDPSTVDKMKSYGTSKLYGVFYILHQNSFHRTESMAEKENINNNVSILASELDDTFNWIIQGDCYFVFENDWISLVKFKSICKDIFKRYAKW